MTAPIVVVVRDPDFSNEFRVFYGPAETYDIDCGRADLSDPGEYAEWREGHLEAAVRFERTGRPEVADHIRGIVEQYRPGADR